MGWFGKRRSSARRKARGSRPPKSPYPERTGWMMEDGWGAVTFEMDDSGLLHERTGVCRSVCRAPCLLPEKHIMAAVCGTYYVLTTAASDDLKRGHIRHIPTAHQVPRHAARGGCSGPGARQGDRPPSELEGPGTAKRLTKRISMEWARSAAGSSKNLSLKYHGVYIDGTGSERTSCGRYKITECEDLGEIPPSTQMCSACSRQDLCRPVSECQCASSRT